VRKLLKIKEWILRFLHKGKQNRQKIARGDQKAAAEPPHSNRKNAIAAKDLE